MAIGNGSGRNVDYEVEPSDPGLTGPVLLSTALIGAGGAFTALGCLTEIGGTPLTVAGLFLLAAALVANVYGLSRIRSAGAMPLSAGTGAKQSLAAGQTVPHTFAAGTWVVFYDDKPPNGVLATSQPIFDSGATVTFRECVDPKSLPDQTQALIGGTPSYHVEVA